MSNASDQRIRHVAIVLQSLDANTSRGLLQQLPPEQSKRVRQAMVQMGTVTPQERAAAFQSMQSLLRAANIRVGSDPSAAKDSESPAAALLASQKVATSDQVDFSPAAYQQEHQTLYGSNGTPNSDIERNDGNWQHLPAEALAEILQTERPIVIATVINQVSVERATAISQALPLTVAAATLAALPHLHLTDPAILRDIQSELERKIGQYQAPKQASAQGLAKLQAIVANMPASQQSNWTSAIAQSNPVLATKLGWTHTQTVSPKSPNLDSNKSVNAFDPSVAITENVTSHPAPNPVVSQTTKTVSAEDDIFDDDAIILPFPSVSKAGKRDEVALNDEMPNKKQNVAPKLTGESSVKSAFDQLLQFSDRDFVTVLHACQPQTVLLALSGAGKPFVSRVERLIPAKDVKRLRERLHSLGKIQLRDVDAAQSNIAETAMKLLANGVIGATSSVSFTAAA